MIEIKAVGGYSEIGRNMTAIKVNGEVVVLDMGINVSKLMELEGDNSKFSTKKFKEIGALPDDDDFKDKWGKDVKAIICSHAHLDHIGGVTRLAKNYKNASIIATPFSIEIIRNQEKDQKRRIPNQIIKLNAGSKYKISKNFEVEFIYTTHSTLQSVMIALHTPEGIIIYTNDFKFDDNPTFGKKPDYKRLKELSKKGVLALFADSTRIDNPGRTFSESVVREMLKDLLLNLKDDDGLIVLTTFASHCVRIRNVLELAKKLKRKPLIFGRSLKNYLGASSRCGLIDFKKEKILSFKNEIEWGFDKIKKQGRNKFLAIMTGNQGEPNSMLSRVSRDERNLSLKHKDSVIFCSETIPTPECIANRATLESNLKKKGVRLYLDYHASGHASREDHRDLINMIKPKHYIPSHGTLKKLASALDLAKEEGYKVGINAHLLQNGQSLKIE